MKPPRLQFSLRMLLALMAAVGIALAIYRWPWEEEKSGVVHLMPPVKLVTRTTYRRDWRGKPVKHGLQQHLWDGKVKQEMHFYEGKLHGERRACGPDGKLAAIVNYRWGLLHGPYQILGPWRFKGQYSAGNWDGEWRGVISQGRQPQVLMIQVYVDDNGLPEPGAAFFAAPPQRPIEIISNYRRGKRHGRTTWQTLDGQVLHTAEYVDGDVVTWNGQPIVDQFCAWLSTLNDPRLTAQLAAGDRQVWRFENKPQALRIKFDSTNVGDLDICLEMPRDFYFEAQNSLTAKLCELAAEQGLGFDYRYGGLWLVLREGDPSPPFVDPTGVDKVHFADGTPQQRAWDEHIDVKSRRGGVKTQLRDVLQDTGIAILFRKPADLEFEIFPSPPTQNLFTRSRRDAVGFVLYQNRCRCELHGNTLLIESLPDLPFDVGE